MVARVVVLGAGGYLGRRVTAAVRADSHAVTAVTRAAAGRRHEPGMTICDAVDFAALRRATEGADWVINTIAAQPGQMVSIAAHLQLLLQSDTIGRVLHVSSLAVFGQNNGVMHEGIIPHPAFGHRYAQAKWQAEKLITTGERLAGRILIVRPGCIYGPGAPVWVNRIARLLQARRLGWLGAQGQGSCLLIHVDDLAEAIARAVSRQISGIFNLVTPEAISWNDYFFRLASLMGALPMRSFGTKWVATETWLKSPARHVAGRLTGVAADCVTPAMRRLFRNRAQIVSIRTPFLDTATLRPLYAGSAEAIDAFLRDPGGPARDRTLPGKGLWLPAS